MDPLDAIERIRQLGRERYEASEVLRRYINGPESEPYDVGIDDSPLSHEEELAAMGVNNPCSATGSFQPGHPPSRLPSRIPVPTKSREEVEASEKLYAASKELEAFYRDSEFLSVKYAASVALGGKEHDMLMDPEWALDSNVSWLSGMIRLAGPHDPEAEKKFRADLGGYYVAAKTPEERKRIGLLLGKSEDEILADEAKRETANS